MLSLRLHLMINTYKVAFVNTTPSDNMASVQLPRAGTIVQVSMAGKCTIETDAIASFQVAINRAAGQFGASVSSPSNVLAEIAIVSLLTTSGFTNAHANAVFPCKYQVNQKDAIYLHGSGSGSSGFSVDVLISVDEA